VRRYFVSHGPATLRDFVWWSGLTASDAKRAVEIARVGPRAIDTLTYWAMPRSRRRSPRRQSTRAHLLPVYDEYLVAYRDLEAVPRGKAFWGILPQAVVIDGQVAGTWKAVRSRGEVVVDIQLGRKLAPIDRASLDEATARYRRFAESAVQQA
jgi:hypothetical protein